MKKAGKLTALLLVAALAAGSLAGCGAADPVKEEYPEYPDDKEMWIGGWDVPINTLEDYQMAKDMGLTHMFIDGVFAARGTDGYFEQLKHCEEVGLKAILGMDTSLDNSQNVPVDTYDYSGYPAVDMINLWDEPPIQQFPDVVERINAMKEVYAGKDMTLYVNMDPFNCAAQPSTLTTTEDYLNKFCDQVLSQIPGRKILSTDIYPLLYTRGQYVISSMWLEHMSHYAQYARREGADFHMFIQSYSDVDRREITSREELTFQIYTDMAFGIKGFSYFTYRKSFLGGFGGGCVENDVSCTPTPVYYWAQEINREIQNFDHVYLAFDWEGVLPVEGSNQLAQDPTYRNNLFAGIANPLTELDCGTVSGTEDTLIGQFKDAEGRDGLIVTNFTDPIYQLKDTVSFSFQDANRAMVYRRGERKIYEVKDNQLEITLSPGEGIFVIPLKIN